MKAWILDEIGAFDTMQIRDMPDPVLADGEAILELGYAALNPADKYLALGQYPAQPPMPHVLGRDGIGTITSIKAAQSEAAGGIGLRWKVGDRAAILRGDTGVARWGTFAQKVSVSLDNLIPIPSGWTDEQASCATLVYITAYQAYTTWDDLPADLYVLVTGASGGVGVASIQLGKAMGHRVIGLSRDASKWDELIRQGADAIFDPNDTQWRTKLKEHTQGAKINFAIDNIGGSLFNEVLSVMSNLGRISCIGRLAGPVPEFNTAGLFFRRIKIGGVAVGTYTNEEAHAAWDAVVALLNSTGDRPVVDHVFPFEQLPKAFERLAHGPLGKVLLQVK